MFHQAEGDVGSKGDRGDRGDWGDRREGWGRSGGWVWDGTGHCSGDVRRRCVCGGDDCCVPGLCVRSEIRRLEVLLLGQAFHPAAESHHGSSADMPADILLTTNCLAPLKKPLNDAL